MVTAVMSEPRDEFAGLAKRLRDSDRSAFARLYLITHRPLLRYAWNLTRSEDAARDVVQDVFLKLWYVRETIDPGRSLKALLYTMVRNRVLNYQRGESHFTDPLEEEEAIDTGQHSVEDRLEAEMLQTCFLAWIEQLPVRRREAFLLSRLHGLNHQQISEVMQLSPATVNRHIILVLSEMRNRLAALHDADTVLSLNQAA